MKAFPSLALLFLVIGTFGFFAACNKYPESKNYIAHGGGEYKNIKVSNSKEAVLNALNNGIKYVELDLALTKDSVIVAAHDWIYFRDLAGILPLIDEPLPENEVRQIKFKEDLTPLLEPDIINLLNEYPDWILVTDKISDPKIIIPSFGQYANRVMIECFDVHDYNTLSEAGFHCFISSSPPPKYKAWLKNFVNIFSSLPKKHVTSIEIYSEEMKKNGIFKPYGYETALFTAQNIEEADSIFSVYPDVNFIYVDNISANN